MVRPARDEWVPCPPGELDRLANKLRGRRQRRVFLRTAGVVATIAAAGGGLSLWLVPGISGERSFGGLTCTEVQQLAEAYGKGKLDESLRAQVRLHVSQCPQCGPHFKAMGWVI